MSIQMVVTKKKNKIKFYYYFHTVFSFSYYFLKPERFFFFICHEFCCPLLNSVNKQLMCNLLLIIKIDYKFHENETKVLKKHNRNKSVKADFIPYYCIMYIFRMLQFDFDTLFNSYFLN